MNTIDRSSEHLSVSQLTTWLQCPRKYRYQYIEHLPWPSVPSSLVFGTAMHAALASFYQARLEGRAAALDELMETYHSAWAAESKPIDFKDDETAESFAITARGLLVKFLETVKPAKVLAVEEPFRIELAEGVPPLIGVIDLVEEIDGRGVVVEHKTAAQRFTDQRVSDDLQPTAYALAALEMGLPGITVVEDVEVRFQVLLKLKAPAIDERPTRRVSAQVEELRDVAQAVWAAREAYIFPPNRGWHCAGCPFEGICRGR